MIIQKESERVWENNKNKDELVQFKSMIAPLLLELAKEEAASEDLDKTRRLLDLLILIEEHDLVLSREFVFHTIYGILCS